MFFRKITSRSKGKEYTYLKLIENYREGGKVKQRVVANLGSLENLTPEKVEGLISGLSRICGLPGDSLQLESKKVLQYGEVMALHKIWEILGLTEAIKEAAGSSHQDLNLPLLLELMAINQAVKPPYKQAVSDWYRYLYLPELEGRELLPHHFYRALDIAGGVKDDLERQVFKKLSSFTAVDADVVFCRLTAGVVESPPREELSLSGYGRYFLEEAAEENKVDFGLLVSRDGIPLGHKMLSQAAEENEFRDIINYARNNFGADRCVFVGDRSFVSHPGLEVLVAHGHEYLLCHKALNALDRNLVAGETAGGLKDFREVNDELYFKEIEEGGLRFLLCYNLKAAKQKKMLLDERLHEVEEELKAIRAEAGRREPGARFAFNKNAAVFKDKHFLKYFNWHYSETAGEFSYQRRDDLIEQERDLAGLFILETNSRALEGGELLIPMPACPNWENPSGKSRVLRPGPTN